MFIKGEAVEVVNQFIYLGTMVNNPRDDSLEIKIRIDIAGSATVSLAFIWKNKAIGKKTKILLMQSLVFPTVLYGCESWAMKKTDGNNIEGLELWAFIRLLRIS